MILTLTMNPSIDMSYQINHLKIDDVNRTKFVDKSAGGKGLNVTRVIRQMNHDVLATGLIGGDLGNFILKRLNADSIDHNFYEIQQESRNSIAIIHDDGNQTEVLEQGPEITKDEADKFVDFLFEISTSSDLVTMSGSLPKGLPNNYYSKLIEKLRDKKILLDTSGESLKVAIQSEIKPFLIKPNQSEIMGLLDTDFDCDDDSEMKNILSNNIFDGIEWIVLSLGSKGAFARHKDKFYRIQVPKIKSINPVGSGDSTLGGLAIGIESKLSDNDVLKYGMTLGILNTLNQKTGCINPDDFDKYNSKISVKEV